MADEGLQNWRLFSSEDMLRGNKPKRSRKSKFFIDKENMHLYSSKPAGVDNPSQLVNMIDLDPQLPSIQHSRSPVLPTPSITEKHLRLPMSDITNNSTPCSSNIYKGKGKVIERSCDYGRNLFDEEWTMGTIPLGDTDHEQIEESIIRDAPFYGEDSDGSDYEFCVEEIPEDVIDESLPVFEHGSLQGKSTRRKSYIFSSEYQSLGGPTATCDKCSAIMWKEERVNKKHTRKPPVFSLCCKKGDIQLPKALPTPPYLLGLHTSERTRFTFQRSIRMYNAIFAFTSSGGIQDHSVNNGGGPYVYRLNGQNHHVFGALIPDDGDTPKFCQLYVYDTGNEVNNRLRWVNAADQDFVNASVVQGLLNMLDETNELCKEFRMARDRFVNHDIVDLKVELKVCRSQSGRENHIAASDDVAGVMVGGTNTTTPNRDIIIESHMDRLQRVSYIHPKLMALQYPLLFPNGEDGYHNKIPFTHADPNSEKDGDMISLKDYYTYRLQVRANEGQTARLGGRLFQQYIVDAFTSIEQTRLWWIRKNQTILRNELYSNICDSVRRGDTSTSNIGRGVILPAGYVGSRRYMQQNFQDALAVCRHVGHPDVFLTMTTNPLWDEIQKMMEHLPFCETSNCPDIISRVFKLKLDQLTNDIKKKKHFGKCIGIMYVVEFQKRGLPHVHMLVWLDSPSKLHLKQNVDKYVSAEIPDPKKDPDGYAAVKAYMMHGPCGLNVVLKCPCMQGFKCVRHFPKKYCPRTVFDDSGFPLYMRRRTNHTIKKGNAELDNQWVVPYNRDLLVKYQCHMNIEICCHARSIKYLFKYCLKGHDTATVQVTGRKRRRTTESGDEEVDEINQYFDGRYVCGSEAAYRIFGFPIHHRTVSVERLPFHLPGERNCMFRANDSLSRVAEREKERLSKLEAFFRLNCMDVNARQYTYDQIPTFYVWNDTCRKWTTRKRGNQIGRLTYTHHTAGELWYLRMLLSKVRGPTSFESLRTINGTCYQTFRDACKEYGLLDDDKEWHEVIDQCAVGGLPPQIRQLFVHIIVNCKVTDLGNLWNSHWSQMIDDILLKRRNLTQDRNLILNEKQIMFYALAEIDDLLRSIGKSLSNYPDLPQPPHSFLKHGVNNLIMEETSYNLGEMEAEHKNLLQNCNEEQRTVYHQIIDCIGRGEGGLFFLYGSGGCGKTYVWRTLISKLRSQGDIVLPVATSGIAATLLPGGRTAHSRFKIPIVLDDCSVCSIGHNSDIAALIRQTKLIIWDEAPMQHRYAFECLDRSLKDIMKSVDPRRAEMPFGGITVVLGGDFRQILPVITYGERGEIVSSSITRSTLWSICNILVLKENMRLKKGTNAQEIAEMEEFAQWVLDIGDGKVVHSRNDEPAVAEHDIIIPPRFCDLENANTVDQLLNVTYPDFEKMSLDSNYLSERAILTPTNQTVAHINDMIVDKLPGESVSYFSVDSAEEFGGTEEDLNNAFPIEYLNSIRLPGMPPHELKLKVGVVVMLIRNLNQTIGLCNGTRMIVTKCLKFCVECEVICGSFVGTRHFIPRMELCPSESRMPFKLIRKQMPLQVCYAMTINKAQGQSLQTVGLFLPKSCFTHGQFYVAISRVTSPHGLKIFVDDETGRPTNVTKNVVYKEIFYDLPTV